MNPCCPWCGTTQPIMESIQPITPYAAKNQAKLQAAAAGLAAALECHKAMDMPNITEGVDILAQHGYAPGKGTTATKWVEAKIDAALAAYNEACQ